MLLWFIIIAIVTGIELGQVRLSSEKYKDATDRSFEELTLMNQMIPELRTGRAIWHPSLLFDE